MYPIGESSTVVLGSSPFIANLRPSHFPVDLNLDEKRNSRSNMETGPHRTYLKIAYTTRCTHGEKKKETRRLNLNELSVLTREPILYTGSHLKKQVGERDQDSVLGF